MGIEPGVIIDALHDAGRPVVVPEVALARRLVVTGALAPDLTRDARLRSAAGLARRTLFACRSVVVDLVSRVAGGNPAAAIARRASRPSRKRRLRRRNHELNHSEISGNCIHKV